MPTFIEVLSFLRSTVNGEHPWSSKKAMLISITISSYFLKYRIPEITTAEKTSSRGAANDFLATVRFFSHNIFFCNLVFNLTDKMIDR